MKRKTSEVMKLRDFFRSLEGDELGRRGDYDGLSPAETAIRAMRELIELKRRRRHRKPRPENSDYPTYRNPHPNGVLAEWVHGQGWVAQR